MAKDLFSEQSKIYAAFRPSYPRALYDFIYTFVKQKNIAWDCATGNGQVAQELCKDFEQVFATDLSQQQIGNAFTAPNIHYSVAPAERTTFESDTFDLITVAQALHWINVDQFYPEAIRVAKNNAILAVWGYSILHVNDAVDRHFLRFYRDVVGPYWDAARQLVEDQYINIPFPFETISTPTFELSLQWTLEQFSGYISSWSATRNYINSNQHDPVPSFIEQLKTVWQPGEIKAVTFPLFLKLGRIKK
jgi:SAM-dependent methyltransferase